MKQYLTEKQINAMILGSSIYSTGGGIEYSTQKKLFKKLLHKQNKPQLVSIDELADDDYVCTAYAVGSAGNTNYDLSESLQIGMKTLENYTGEKFRALFGGETNADILAFQTASSMHLPVLDADSNGGRAVPEIQHDNFIITGKSITPLVAVTPDKRVAILTQSPDGLGIEKFVRSMSSTIDKGLIAVLDHPIKVKDAKKVLTLGIFSRSIQLGDYILSNKKTEKMIQEIPQKVPGQVLIQGFISKLEVKHDVHGGFLTGYYYVQNTNGDTVKVFIKNENLIAWKNDQLLMTAPDAIIAVDTKTFVGVHNSKLYQGQEVIIIGKKAPEMWRSAVGKKLFSPKHFGFSFANKLLS